MAKRNKTQETTLNRLPKCTTGIQGLDEITEGGLPRGRPTLICGSAGLTEQKRSEEASEQLAAIVQSSEDAIIGKTLEGIILSWNSGAEKIYGYSSVEVIGRHFSILLPPNHPDEVSQILERIGQGESIKGYETVCIRKDGQLIHISMTASPVRDITGKIVSASIITRDITEHKRMEDALQEYQKVIENSQDMVAVVDQQYKYLLANARFLEMRGMDREQVVGRPVSEVVSKEVFERIIKRNLDACFHGKIVNYEMKNAYPGLGERDLMVSYFPIQDQDGISRVASVIQDITERKQAEEKLRDSEARYRDLIETARDVIFTLSTQGVFTSFNSVFETITGWSTKEWIGKVFVDLLDPNDVPKAIQRFKSVMEGQLGEPIELRIRTKCGGVVHGEFVASPQVKEGKVIGILGVARDITERKKAEEALCQEKDFNQTLVQASPLFFVAIGPDGKTLMMNEAMLHALGYTSDEVVGKDYLSTFTPVADRETVLPIFEKLVNQKESTLNENRVLTKDGRELLVEWHGRPVLKANGDLDYFFGVGIDITQRRQVAEKMASLQEQLRQSQKIEAIGRLAGGIAHDFNNLLTVISGNCQLSLLELKEDVSLRENMEEIKRASEKAADLTRQLLAFSRRQILEMKVLDLNTVLRDLDKMLHRLIGEDIELTTLLADDLGRVKTDPGWVEQIIMNLAVNARDAMPNGGKLTIETANVELDEAYAFGHIAVRPGRYVMLSMSDTGVGMTPEIRQQVFEPFFTTKERGKGTGLGLSTVYGIVKQSGGNIWVYSEPRKGSTFKIYLPRVDEPAEELKQKVVKGELPRGSETILIVEDEKEVLRLAGRILRRQGYSVLEVSGGEEALKVCKERKEPFHLLLTDVVMPQMSGRQLAEQLKQVYQNFKVLYVSGYTNNAITHHGVLEAGLNYLQKPFTVDGLAKKVRDVLDK